METSARRLLIKKNGADNWNLGLFNSVFQCIKCRKYNAINYTNSENTLVKYQNCQFCSNPNYIKKK
jgi:hypothetical protein